MLKIGLTGGIGSGKSTVSRLFAMLGVPVYDTDSAAKRLMNTSAGLIADIEGIFGPAAYRGGVLDRGYVASKVFTDRSLLERLDAVVHPAVIADFMQWCDALESEGCPYVIHESAILFESGFADRMNVCVTVSAPVELRVQRAVARDASDPAKVRARMANQMDDAERERRADYIITNDETALLIPQVLGLDKIFRG